MIPSRSTLVSTTAEGVGVGGEEAPLGDGEFSGVVGVPPGCHSEQGVGAGVGAPVGAPVSTSTAGACALTAPAPGATTATFPVASFALVIPATSSSGWLCSACAFVSASLAFSAVTMAEYDTEAVLRDIVELTLHPAEYASVVVL